MKPKDWLTTLELVVAMVLFVIVLLILGCWKLFWLGWTRFWMWFDQLDANTTPEEAEAIILYQQLTRNPG